MITHVETVVLLSQQKPDEHIRIKIDLDELDETSAETNTTYDKIRYWVGDNYQLHVTNLNIAQVGIHRHICRSYMAYGVDNRLTNLTLNAEVTLDSLLGSDRGDE